MSSAQIRSAVAANICLILLVAASPAVAQDQYLVGDWDGDGRDNLAVRVGNMILMDTDGDGVPDKEQPYGDGNVEDEYLVGDWDNSGRSHIAVRRGNRILMDTNSDGAPDREETFGNGNRESQYLVGDWNGNGRSDIGVRRRNRIVLDEDGDGTPDTDFTFGRGNDRHFLVGDWDGDGSSNIAVRRGNTIVMDTNFDQKPELEFSFGGGDSESEYLVGDWDGDGRDNLAVRRGNSILMDTNFDNAHDLELTFVVPDANSPDPTATTVAEVEVSTQIPDSTPAVQFGDDTIQSGEGQDRIVGNLTPVTQVVAGEVTIAPEEAEEAPAEATPTVVQGRVSIGQAPTPPPSETPTTPAGEGTLTVSTTGVSGLQVVTQSGEPISYTTQGGQTILLGALVPQGTTQVGTEVSANRQEQVLLRLYGLPYGAYPMLEAAARRYLTRRGQPATAEAVAAYLKSIYDDSDGRLGFAPAVLMEGLDAILADERNEWQQAFYSAFGAYSGALQYQAITTLYRSWKWYRGETLNGINPVVEYKPSGLGVLLDTGKKLSDFRPPESPLDVGPAGLLAAVNLYGQGVAPDLEIPPINDEIDPTDLADLATLTGLGGPVMFLSLGTQFNSNFQSVVLKHAAYAQKTGAQIAANETSGLDRTLYNMIREADPQNTPPFEKWLLQRQANKAVTEGAQEVGEAASKRVVKELSEDILQRVVVREVSEEVSERFASRIAAKVSARIIGVLGKTGAAVLGGFLMGLPAIIDVVMAIVEFAETEKFDAEITAAFLAGPNFAPDLKAMIAPKRQFQDGLCYEWCKPEYSGLATLCYKDCPSDYRTDPATCVRDPHTVSKERYYRGQTAMTCAPGQEQDAGLCYQQCQTDYRGVATMCYQSDCPAGFRDDGLYCGKPQPYSREGFAWQIGDPPLPNYSGPTSRCEAKYGTGNCEQWGALIYPKCQPNYYASGCCICTPNCPSGWEDIGVSCKKPSYDRGVGAPLSSCPAGHEQTGALCYPTCRTGFTGELDWCTKHECPQGYRSDPLTCIRDAHVFGRESYDRGIGFVAATQESCESEDKRISNIAAVVGHMTKMMVTDAADAGILVLPGEQISPVPPQMMGITAYY